MAELAVAGGRAGAHFRHQIGEVEPEAVRIAILPTPRDHSAIGAMPRTTGYYIAITHSSATMSPFLGAVVADEIVHWWQRG